MVAPTTLQNFVTNVFDLLKCGCFFYFGVVLLKILKYTAGGNRTDRQINFDPGIRSGVYATLK